jgi:hypothetical protein
VKLAFLALALLLPQEKNEAEELFKKMQAKFVEAKTIRMKLKGSMGDGQVNGMADLWLAEENRVRYSWEMKVGAVTRSFETVSDGKTIQTAAGEGHRLQSQETPEAIGRLMRKTIAICGGLSGAGVLSGGLMKADPATAFKVSEFALGPKEKIGEIDAVLVQFKVATKYESGITSMVWIDPKTHLPLRRKLITASHTTEETCTEIKLDEKIDASKFELPKDAK